MGIKLLGGGFDKHIVEEYKWPTMIIKCPECGEENITDKPIQPDKRYRCGKCGAVVITLQQPTDNQDELTNPLITNEMDNTPKENTVSKVNKGKENKLSAALILLSLVLNFINYTFFYGYSSYNFYQDIGGFLGITTPVAGFAGIVALLSLISKKRKHGYLYYFAILFIVLSSLSLVISIANAAYESGF